jgi:hypothetical protein
MSFSSIINNFTFVSINHDRSMKHWRNICDMNRVDQHFYRINREVLVKQKAVTGILSHHRATKFRLHVIKERMRERSVKRRKLK